MQTVSSEELPVTDKNWVKNWSVTDESSNENVSITVRK